MTCAEASGFSPRLFTKAKVFGQLGDEWFANYHTCDDNTSVIKKRFLEQGYEAVSGLL